VLFRRGYSRGVFDPYRPQRDNTVARNHVCVPKYERGMDLRVDGEKKNTMSTDECLCYL